MFSDEKMRKLIADDEEPIKTFIDSVKDLYETHKVSTILVMGAIGEYFHQATEVIGMKNNSPAQLTDKAKSIALDSKVSINDKKIVSFNNEERRYVPNYHLFGEGKAKD